MATPTETGAEAFRTQGIRQNANLLFDFELSGQQVYNLLQLLERIAVQNADFRDVRECVLFAEQIREQARQQGF